MTRHAAVDWSSAQVETTRLAVRPAADADAQALGQAWHDAAAHRGTPAAGAGGHSRGSAAGWPTVAVDRASGGLVGAASLSPVPAGVPTARLELWIAGAARRRGFGTELAAALGTWAFGHGAVRVELLAAVGNLPAQRLALAAGFRREAQLRAAAPDGGGTVVDGVLFGRLATDSAGAPPRALPDVRELTDGVVTLRPLRAGDEDAVLDERSDPQTQRWATTSRLWTAVDARAYVAAAGALWLAGREARFAIVDTASGTYAGSLGMRLTVAQYGIAEIGYGLRAGWRGRGCATRAVRLLADWAFNRAGIARLELGTAVGNVASQRVAERAGFQREGIARLRLPTSDGGRTDEMRFGLLPPR